MIYDSPKNPDETPSFPRELLLNFGKTGMGKSNYMKGFLETLPRTIILDPLGEYQAREFEDVRGMIDFLESENVKGDPEKPFRIKTCNLLDLEAVCEICADGDKKNDPNAMRNVTLVIEEAQRCLPPSRIEIPDALQRIIFLGRHFGRSLAIAAQRPSIVHIAARSQWTRIVTFNLTETGDVGWLKSTSGYDIENENDIRKLPVGDYFEITPGSFERKRAPLYVPKKTRKEEESSDGILAMLSAFNLQT